jgi:hypothetical protein
MAWSGYKGSLGWNTNGRQQVLRCAQNDNQKNQSRRGSRVTKKTLSGVEFRRWANPLLIVSELPVCAFHLV